MKPVKFIIIVIGVVIVSLWACEEVLNNEDIDPRDKFIGSWNASESCYKGNFVVNIIEDPSNTAQVLLENFANPGPGYDGAIGVVANDRIVLNSQEIGEDWSISGIGTYSNNTIEWEYSLVYSGTSEECSATYTK